MKAILTTDVVLGRFLMKALTDMGYARHYAAPLIETMFKEDTRLWLWSAWLNDNCTKCVNDPSECSFFNPKQEECANASPDEVRNGNLHFVEQHWGRCPLLFPISVDTKS